MIQLIWMKKLANLFFDDIVSYHCNNDDDCGQSKSTRFVAAITIIITEEGFAVNQL